MVTRSEATQARSSRRESHCLYSLTIGFGMGSSTAWGLWEEWRGTLLDGNLTFEHRLYLVLLILSTVHVRLFSGKSGSRRKTGSEEKVLCKSSKWPNVYSCIHRGCALEVRNFFFLNYVIFRTRLKTDFPGST